MITNDLTLFFPKEDFENYLFLLGDVCEKIVKL